MAVITLRAPLKQRAGTSSVEVEGGTVRAAIVALERAVPAVKGWIADEQGDVRRHVNVFVNGEPAQPEDPVAPNDRIDIIHAITGG